MSVDDALVLRVLSRAISDAELMDAAVKLNTVLAEFKNNVMNEHQYDSLTSLYALVMNLAEAHAGLSVETDDEIDRLVINYNNTNITRAKYPPMPNAIK